MDGVLLLVAVGSLWPAPQSEHCPVASKWQNLPHIYSFFKNNYEWHHSSIDKMNQQDSDRNCLIFTLF
jgi:hypothetical protein